jgi:hypothetical protein
MGYRIETESKQEEFCTTKDYLENQFLNKNWLQYTMMEFF